VEERLGIQTGVVPSMDRGLFSLVEVVLFMCLQCAMYKVVEFCIAAHKQAGDKMRVTRQPRTKEFLHGDQLSACYIVTKGSIRDLRSLELLLRGSRIRPLVVSRSPQHRFL
jgi:hypothetical protein